MAILPNKLHVGYLTFTVPVLSGRLKNQIIKADISPLILTPVYQKPIYRVGICNRVIYPFGFCLLLFLPLTFHSRGQVFLRNAVFSVAIVTWITLAMK